MNLAEKAALLGVSCREFVRLGNSDPRNVADAALASANARAKLLAWVAAGEPDGDLAQLEYAGDAGIRRIVETVLASIPTYARWHAVTKVLWCEIGRGDPSGWCGVICGEPRHVIMLNGKTADDVLPAVIAHELAHAIDFALEQPKLGEMPEAEWSARVLAAATFDAADDAAAIEQAVRWQYRPEVFANDLARAWGYSCAIDGLATDAQRTAKLRRELTSARARANEVIDDVTQQFAAINKGH